VLRRASVPMQKDKNPVEELRRILASMGKTGDDIAAFLERTTAVVSCSGAAFRILWSDIFIEDLTMGFSTLMRLLLYVGGAGGELWFCIESTEVMKKLLFQSP